MAQVSRGEPTTFRDTTPPPVDRRGTILALPGVMLSPRPLALLFVLGCSHGFADPSREYADPVAADAPHHPEVVHVPETLGSAETDRLDAAGRPIGVTCATCHGPEAEEAMAEHPDAPDGFHDSVEVKHGTLSCWFCHDEEDRSKLHLADGTRIDMQDTMLLCAQCHGVQHRDYRNGSHGGMNGYWDLSRGPRTRNTCTDCHDPHAPAFPSMKPTFKPIDRGLEPAGEHK